MISRNTPSDHHRREEPREGQPCLSTNTTVISASVRYESPSQSASTTRRRSHAPGAAMSSGDPGPDLALRDDRDGRPEERNQRQPRQPRPLGGP